MAISAELRDRLLHAAQQQMAADVAHDLAHLDRVWRNVCDIADDKANFRVLVAATYLHDIVNLPKNAPNRAQASRMAAGQAAPILRELGFTERETKAVQHAIEAHSFSAGIQPQSVEAKILRDADRLDALGAIGIARTFAVAGALNRPLYDPDDPFARTRGLDERQFSIDHWKAKLLRLPADMLTPRGRDLAEQRAARMLRFLSDFAAEIGTDLPEDWAIG